MLIAMRQGRVPSAERLAVASTVSGRLPDEKAYWEFVEHRGRDCGIAVVWNGNQHNAGFLIRPDPPLRVFHNAVDPARQPDSATWAPQEIFRERWKETTEALGAVLSRLAAVTRALYVVGTPPPKPDAFVESVLKTDAFFSGMISELGFDGAEQPPITAGSTRLALWWIVQDMLAEQAAAVDAEFVPAPGAAFDEEGFLRPELCVLDATHANEEYGLLIWEALAASAVPGANG